MALFLFPDESFERSRECAAAVLLNCISHKLPMCRTMRCHRKSFRCLTTTAPTAAATAAISAVTAATAATAATAITAAANIAATTATAAAAATLIGLRRATARALHQPPPPTHTHKHILTLPLSARSST
eukprot:1082125-Pleurochrysis_carterae.AAC.2